MIRLGVIPMTKIKAAQTDSLKLRLTHFNDYDGIHSLYEDVYKALKVGKAIQDHFELPSFRTNPSIEGYIDFGDTPPGHGQIVNPEIRINYGPGQRKDLLLTLDSLINSVGLEKMFTIHHIDDMGMEVGWYVLRKRLRLQYICETR